MFFIRAAWIGRNSRSISVSLLLEVLALVMAFCIATRIPVSWTLPLRY